MKISTVYLDAGGIILNENSHEKIRAEIISNLLNKINSSYNEKKYRSDARDALNKYAVHIYNYIIWNNTKDIELYKKTLKEFRNEFKRINPPLVLMKGIKKVLTELSKELNIGIIGQYGMEIINLLEDNNLIKLIKYKNHQDDFQITKPDPRYYELILKNNQVLPGESIMIGDRIDKDIIPARQIGMKTIRVLTGIHKNQKPRYPEEQPDIEINDIKEIADAVNKIRRL